MRPTALDTLARIVAMVLAGMVSLSILGAIAAMSEGRLGAPSSFPLDPRPSEMPERADERTAAAQNPGGLRRSDSPSPATTAPAAAPAPPPGADERAARWLEVIAYVLFAIAFLLALGVLALWRLAATLRRSASLAAERLNQENRSP
jgi:hypothetical protein